MDVISPVILKRISICLWVAVIVTMIAGTLLEKKMGSSAAQAHIYYAPWFMALWLLLLVFSLVFIIKEKRYQRWSVLLLYAAAVLMVAGMMLTTFTAKQGFLTLKKGNPSNIMVSKAEQPQLMKLPFGVELLNFEVITYPGTQTPQTFRSEVRFMKANTPHKQANISMNKIGRYNNYRFYQYNYDKAGHVTLAVSFDPYGIALTYFGYTLLLLSFILSFFDKKGLFRKLLAELSQHKKVATIGFLLLGLPYAQVAQGQTPPTLPKESAAKMGKLYVMYNDRICPLQTVAKDFTTKLYGSPTYKGLSAEQVFAGWLFYFDEWSVEPMIKVKGKDVRTALNLQGKYARLTDFYDPTRIHYRLKEGLSLRREDPRRAKFIATDEKYNLAIMLHHGQLLKIFPIKDSLCGIRWYLPVDSLPPYVERQESLFIHQFLRYSSAMAYAHNYTSFDELMEKTIRYQKRNAGTALPKDLKIGAERWGNWLALRRSITMGFVFGGLLLFGYALYCLARCHSLAKGIRLSSLILMIFLTTYLCLLFMLRWIVAGYTPLSNGYETMTFLGLSISIIAIVLCRRNAMALPFGLLMSGLALLVATIGGSSPSVTLLTPVLASPLLSIHVSVIMLAYTLLSFVMLNGIAALILAMSWHLRGRSQQLDILQRLRVISSVLLYPAVIFLAIGILIGAIWANNAWGSYWSWDPKEVWALITLLLYAAPLLRTEELGKQHSLRFHLYVVLAFLSVLITYFGVNLILGGLHSYA